MNTHVMRPLLCGLFLLVMSACGGAKFNGKGGNKSQSEPPPVGPQPCEVTKTCPPPCDPSDPACKTPDCKDDPKCEQPCTRDADGKCIVPPPCDPTKDKCPPPPPCDPKKDKCPPPPPCDPKKDKCPPPPCDSKFENCKDPGQNTPGQN